MSEYTYTYQKLPVNGRQLAEEIRDLDTITVALERVDILSNQEGVSENVRISFKAEISDDEELALEALVTAHVADFSPPVDVVVTGKTDGQGGVIVDGVSPVTPDGETHTIQSNLGKITGNEIVNWTMDYNLNTGNSIAERYVIPNGKTVSIEFVQGYSPAIPYSVELNWYVNRAGTTFRRNPAMRARDFFIARVDGNQPAPNTTIVLKNVNGFQFRDLEVNKAYEFLTSSGTRFNRIVTSKDVPTKTVTLDSTIPSDLSNNDKVALIDRPIAKLGGDASNALMDFKIAPTFRGNDQRYLELVVKNESPTDNGEVFAVVNGWLTSTVSGTIPGKGGGERDEE